MNDVLDGVVGSAAVCVNSSGIWLEGKEKALVSVAGL
jgi:hypothetical protein